MVKKNSFNNFERKRESIQNKDYNGSKMRRITESRKQRAKKKIERSTEEGQSLFSFPFLPKFTISLAIYVQTIEIVTTGLSGTIGLTPAHVAASLI